MIVALYAAFLGRFLVRAFPEKVLHYPHAAAAELHVLVFAWSQAAYWQVAKIAGNLVALSVWPIGISLLVVVIARAVVGLKERKIDSRRQGSGSVAGGDGEKKSAEMVPSGRERTRGRREEGVEVTSFPETSESRGAQKH